ncbi:MAG: transposase [bacterium]|nr:transposase [bacterium]
MLRRVPLISDETYHVYNRGAGKQRIYTTPRDYERFMGLLCLANSKEPITYRGPSSVGIFKQEKEAAPTQKLVDVLAYVLMPNHFHLVLKQIKDEGITKFMRKLATGYSMYFNIKYEHSGVLFQGRFKSSHINSEPYFRYIFSYVHLNPVELIEPDWKEGTIRNEKRVRKFLADYRYGSYFDYCVGERPERAILAYDDAPDFLKEQNDLEEMLSDFSKGRILHTDDGVITEDRPR